MSALIAIRFIHFTALMLVCGACLFRPWLLELGAQRARLRNLVDPLVCLLAAAALISGVAWLVAVALEMAGVGLEALSPQLLGKVLGQTFFGKVWALHLALCVALLVCLRVPLPWTAVIARPLSALALASLAPVGHAASLDGVPGQLLLVNQLLHLLLCGAWLGALMVLALMLRGRADAQVVELVRRFSQLAPWLVLAIVVTGLLNVRLLTGSYWPWPGASSYANALALKMLLVLATLGLAARNRLLLRAPSPDLAALKTGVTAEWLCAVAAMASVAWLGTLAPAIDAAAMGGAGH